MIGSPEAGIRAALGSKLTRSMDGLMSGVIRPLVSRAATRRPPNRSGRRFCVIHLDGVSRDTLLAAVRRGYAPFLGRLMRSGAYQFSPCWSGAPSSTPAFQAGLLYGIREPNIPGFMWFDRRLRREVRMDRAEDAAAVEAQLSSRAEGLMRRGGSTSFSVFSGGAEVNGYTMAGWASERVRLLPGYDAWHLAAATVAHSFTAARILGRMARESGGALVDLFRQSALVGRFQHEPTFLLHRIGLAVGAREAATFGTVLDLARGVPAIYTCFGDYDEIAHRRGPSSRMALLALWGIDRAVARIFAAASAIPEMAYDFYVVADHGQVPTRPFENATGLTLADYLAVAVPDGEGPPRLPGDAVREIGRWRAMERAAGALPSGAGRAREAALDAARAVAHTRNQSDVLRQLSEVVNIDAGDIAHIYLGSDREPLSLEQIERRFPRILAVLTRCPAVGIVAARSGRGAVAWIRGRRVDLSDPADLSHLAIGYGGRMVAGFLNTMMRIPNAGDLVAYGNGLPDGDVAFAWEFGSHAGVAREEVETYVIHPAAARFDFSSVQHGADLHDFLVAQYDLDRRAPAPDLEPGGVPLAH